MSEVVEMPVDEASRALLPGARFADSFAVALPEPGVTAPQLAERLFRNSPPWVGRLIAWRNRLTAPLGLKPAGNGPFPVLESAPQRVVMGLDDRHLDFRLLLGVEDGQARVTTLVRTRNALGRAYLAAILPFHRMVARAMLANMVGPQP